MTLPFYHNSGNVEIGCFFRQRAFLWQTRAECGKICIRRQPVHTIIRVMNMKNWKTYAAWIVGTEAVGGLSGWLTRNGAQIYADTITKPPLSPPALVFPIVWALLFALMGIGAARIWMSQPSPERSRSLKLFFLQLGVNFFWSIIFFNLQNFGFALLWLLLLWVLILAMILAFRRVDKPAALMQIPYLLWVTFAAYLNLGVWLLN